MKRYAGSRVLAFAMVLAMALALSTGWNPNRVVAQDTELEAPIVALVDNTIYAVSSVDGSAYPLVERPAGVDAALEAIDVNPAVRLGPVAPDNATLVYIAPEADLLSPVLA